MSKSGTARADLDADATRLSAAWRSVPGLTVERRPPLFLERGHPSTVRLPEAALTASDSDCTTLALLAGRSVDFVVSIDPVQIPKHRPKGGSVRRSLAGGVLVARCGDERGDLERLAVEVRAARAALEVILARGPKPAPGIELGLPERGTGPTAPLASPGPPPPLPPFEARVSRTALRGQRAGATDVSRTLFVSTPEGAGFETLILDEGCHRLSVLPEVPTEGQVDVDADLREPATGRILARDRSDSVDAELGACVGERASFELVYAGAPAGATVAVVDARFPLAPGLPRGFGSRARASLGSALFRHELGHVASTPIEYWQGAAGRTPLHISVSPGSCYLAAAAPTSGDPRLIGLGAKVDTVQMYDLGLGSEGAAVTFCAESLERAELQVEMRGTGAGWLLAVWRVAESRLGEARW